MSKTGCPWFDQYNQNSSPSYDDEIFNFELIGTMLKRARKAQKTCEVIRHFYQYAQSGCTLIDSINGALKDHKLEVIELE